MAVAPIHPPASWFEHPGEIPTDRRLTITAEGRVYGYVALWDTCYVGGGHGACATPPRSADYEAAHQGSTQTAEGELIATANVGGSGHAPLDASPAAATAHYEQISEQMMRVRYGEDDNGIWFSGAIWPDLDPVQVEHIRASAVSGDWRWMSTFRKTKAGYGMVGSCLVNVPGFPIANADNSAAMNIPSEGMLALAASADIYALDGFSSQGASVNDASNSQWTWTWTGQAHPFNTTVAPITASPADCGCESPPVIVADAGLEALEAVNMKLDQALSELAGIKEELAQKEADHLLSKLSEVPQY